MDSIKRAFVYRFLLYELVSRNFKLQYRRSFLGYLWSMLKPLLMMLVLTAVFSSFFSSSIEKFPVYLILGQTIFNFYSEATNSAMTSICFSGSLIKKVYVPKYIFPMASVCFSFVNMSCSLFSVVLVMIIYHVPLSKTMLLAPLLFLYTFLISLGLGLILSTLAVFFRDIIHLYSVFLMAQMYLTPIFYPADMLPENILGIVKFNPAYHLVQYFRKIMLYRTWPSMHENLVCIIFALVLLGTGLIFMKRNQDKFILYV